MVKTAHVLTINDIEKTPALTIKARFKRRTFHAPSRMQINKNNLREGTAKVIIALMLS